MRVLREVLDVAHRTETRSRELRDQILSATRIGRAWIDHKADMVQLPIENRTKTIANRIIKRAQQVQRTLLAIQRPLVGRTPTRRAR